MILEVTTLLNDVNNNSGIYIALLIIIIVSYILTIISIIRLIYVKKII